MRRVVLSLATVFCCFGFAVAAEHTKDTPEEVKKAIDEKKAVLIDVREVKEWEAGHLKQATNVPLSVLKKGLSDDEFAKKFPKGKIIYMHCKAGGRCLSAAEFLKDKGYDLRPLKQGYEDLAKEGFEKDKK